MNRFLVVSVGRNCGELAARCLDSLAEQTDKSFDVCAVDDASTEPMRLESHFLHPETIRTEERRYALANQVAAWRLLEPEDDDVIVFVDLDDRLARPDALEIVRRYYERGALLTYGSYRPVPADHPDAATCRPAKPYPEEVVLAGSYRRSIQWFNHLRTVSWRLLKHVSEEDLRDSRGEYWRANTDRAVMWPCLEMAGPRAVFIPEILYDYTCDNPQSVWRVMSPLLVRENRELQQRPRKQEVA